MEIIKKTKKMLKVKPNLGNYEKTYKTFKWEQVEKQIEWFPGKKLNIAYVAIDKHLKTRKKNKVALYWENDKGEKKSFTFKQLSELSNKVANILKKYKIKKADRVFIFLPRIPELFYSFYGILKTGGIASIIFQAFGEYGLYDRLNDSGSRFLITDKELFERVKPIRKKLPNLEHILLIGDKIDDKNVIDFRKELENASDKFEILKMSPNDYAFMLYTSGTTGKPVGVVHAHKAIIQQHMTAKWVLDLKEKDVYWCTADPGWITGIVYGILSNFSNGVTSVAYEGHFSPEKWYEILEKYKVNVFYTAPTAIRMLMKSDGNLIKKYNLSNLRHLCSVGEALNPEAIRWGIKNFGLPFHDTWWQTETGAMMICNLPSEDIILGSMGKPLPGIKPLIVDEKGKKLADNIEGDLTIEIGWPSMMVKAWGKNDLTNHEIDLDIGYIANGLYYTGDKAKRDKNGNFYFISRADDVIKTSGERVGPFEVESALMEHKAIGEAAVIGKPDKLRGEIIKAFCILKPGFKPSEELKSDITEFVKKKLAGHAYPREIEFVNSLPKTRSGKIMRRILKAKELGLPTGDLSTLEE